MARSTIFGFTGHQLTASERAFFRDAVPWGFIVMGRNVDSPKQLRALTDSLRELTGRADLPILVDQEGGRVARLKAPHWRHPPIGARFGQLYSADADAGIEAIRLNGRLIAQELREVGITVDCLPVLDVPVPGSDAIIGDRAYAQTPAAVAVLGRAIADGLLDGGVLPVMKHIPGHGRAPVDSHKALPRVTASLKDLEANDFAPFKQLADLPLAMTAHVVFEAIDPQHAATQSAVVIERVIRGTIGFRGLLMSDDISANMKAMGGTYADRARRSLAAGCDVALHCNGDMSEMKAVAEASIELKGEALKRAERATALLKATWKTIDLAAETARLDRLLAAKVA